MKDNDKPKQVIVTLNCTVKKQVVCEGCTPEEAEANPYDYCVDEVEIDQMDWEVIDIQVEE